MNPHQCCFGKSFSVLLEETSFSLVQCKLRSRFAIEQSVIFIERFGLISGGGGYYWGYLLWILILEVNDIQIVASR